MTETTWEIVRALHLLAMAFFVGGQLFLAAVVVPVERRAPDRERLRGVARRFGYGTLVAVGVLIATGVAMAEHYQRWSDETLQIKLGFVAATGALIVVHLRRSDLRWLDGVIFLGSLVIAWLGLTLAH